MLHEIMLFMLYFVEGTFELQIFNHNSFSKSDVQYIIMYTLVQL